MLFNYNNGYFFGVPFLPPNCQKPPTIYSILESIVNGNVDLNEPAPDVKIKDLAKEGRKTIFNFDYPLSSNVDKEKFETMILNHYLMRRIGFETVTAFRIQLDVKLNEIMPIYNKLFDALENWQIFNDGETTTRIGTDDRTTNSSNKSNNNVTSNNKVTNSSTTNSNNINDNRYSNTPQNQIDDIKNGNYVTDYTYTTTTNNSNDNSTSNGSSTSEGSSTEQTNTTDNNKYNEIIQKTPADKISIYKEMQENIKSIYSMIFNELDVLFYDLI